eukprot:TRINITY_DN38032_c0_g1_i1.p1 TRINITY_DN38032_c0_g1~~TRINITY_DN38032_c0_g1_i1.p1  ORF type:complete len:175 (+),score=9.39 TRINITY_DN38032_c0_g1_i1:263-787(+)
MEVSLPPFRSNFLDDCDRLKELITHALRSKGGRMSTSMQSSAEKAYYSGRASNTGSSPFSFTDEGATFFSPAAASPTEDFASPSAILSTGRRQGSRERFRGSPRLSPRSPGWSVSSKRALSTERLVESKGTPQRLSPFPERPLDAAVSSRGTRHDYLQRHEGGVALGWGVEALR